jgi:hypothetical protein
MPQLMYPIYTLFGLPDLPGLSSFAGVSAPFIEFVLGACLVVKDKRVQTVGLLLVKEKYSVCDF